MSSRDERPRGSKGKSTRLYSESVNPAMISLARESLGLSQKQLETIIPFSQAEISRIEAGLRPASDRFITELSNALGYRRAFFFRSDPIYGVGISEMFHRKRQEIAVRLLQQTYALVHIRRMEVTRLLQAVEFGECDIPHIDPIEHDADPKEVARAVRAQWLIPAGPIASVCEVVENAGGLIIPCVFPTRRIDAISQWLPGLPPLFFVNPEIPQDRLRFTLSHELAHMIMHHAVRPNLDPDIEKEAHLFAAEFLLPAKDIAHGLYDLSIERLAVLKLYWRVAMSAILMRASDLGRIDRVQGEYLWKRMGKLGYRKREPSHLDVTGDDPRLLKDIVRVHTDELGFDLEEMSKLTDLPEEVFRMAYIRDDSNLRLVS